MISIPIRITDDPICIDACPIGQEVILMGITAGTMRITADHIRINAGTM
jgi:hypothetical protein